jgi:hypothetical protein
VRWLFLIVGFFVWLLPAGAQAETISVAHKITVTAKVAPTRTIVVDNSGKIVKIFSNTSAAVEPIVFKNSIAGPNSVALTDQILQQYRHLLPSRAGPGLVYSRATTSKANPLALAGLSFNI